jgi:hypothetical protein
LIPVRVRDHRPQSAFESGFWVKFGVLGSKNRQKIVLGLDRYCPTLVARVRAYEKQKYANTAAVGTDHRESSPDGSTLPPAAKAARGAMVVLPNAPGGGARCGGPAGAGLRPGSPATGSFGSSFAVESGVGSGRQIVVVRCGISGRIPDLERGTSRTAAATMGRVNVVFLHYAATFQRAADEGPSAILVSGQSAGSHHSWCFSVA